jgi:hypothetical protein
MKNILILFLFLITSCGYQPLYVNKENNNNFKFQEIKLLGNQNLNKKISSALSFELTESDNKLNKIILNSKKEKIETSKNSKGQVTSYRTSIIIDLTILNNEDNILKQKIFTKDFAYNVNDNKFKLSEYQQEIESNLINKIIEEIIIYLNL